MRKFKHLPSNKVACFRTDNNGDLTSDGWLEEDKSDVPLFLVKHSNRDWKEITQDWEITSFKSIQDCHVFLTNGRYRVDEGMLGYSLTELLSLPTVWLIHSVKRLLDGVEFKIGDRTQLGIIKTFYISSDIIEVQVGKSDEDEPLLDLQKIEKIFTTEDGIDLYGGETVWYGCLSYDKKPKVWKVNLFNIYNVQGIKRRSNDIETFKNIEKKTPHSISWKTETDFLVFSTEKAARDFIFPKKPLFTTKDGVDMYDGDNFYFVRDDWQIYPYTVSSLLTIKKEYKYFSTQELAREYALLNQPTLSIAEVIDIMACGQTDINAFKGYVKKKLSL